MGGSSSRKRRRSWPGFAPGGLQVLVATSLIEVGLDVPNATVMLIDNAEQFGLAQLHQLRGRIGRGAHDSYCILLAGARSKDAQERLKVLEETCDGFRSPRRTSRRGGRESCWASSRAAPPSSGSGTCPGIGNSSGRPES